MTTYTYDLQTVATVQLGQICFLRYSLDINVEMCSLSLGNIYDTIDLFMNTDDIDYAGFSEL